MRRALLVLLLAGWTASFLPESVRAQTTPPSPAPGASSSQQATLNRYCVTCHNSKLKTGGVVLEALDLTRVSEHADLWERIITKLRTESMPPPGAPRPGKAAHAALAGWLEGELDRAAVVAPNPGTQPLLHRLNRSEYQNAVRDLLALDDLPKELDIAVRLPADDASYGFDNIADALGTSPTLLESYLSAAQKISPAASELGKLTRLPSLELALETQERSLGSCDNGYACVYMNTISWRTPTSPVPMETHPRIVFDRLFGDAGVRANDSRRSAEPAAFSIRSSTKRRTSSAISDPATAPRSTSTSSRCATSSSGSSAPSGRPAT